MAQVGSVQREPSMEEILASIRRIIEDSDGPQQQAAGAPPAGLENGTDEDFDETGEVDHFRAELEPAAQPENVVSDLRLAEASDELAGAAMDHATPAPTESSVLDWPVNDWNRHDSDEEPDAAATFLDEDIAAAEPSGQEEPEQGVGEASGRRPAIISELAERKIAAAFEELNEAFEVSRRQSLDEMAEEMLRPMLQDWLDNNLPRLVEKLVREEIERVARGGVR